MSAVNSEYDVFIFDEKCCIFIHIPLEFVLEDLIDNKPVMAQVTAYLNLHNDGLSYWRKYASLGALN